jgi:DNA-binding beta-propeller fold protein YncE
LGYWLEQQGVNRGSQPWYFYTLIQIPVYEFLPALGVILAACIVLYKSRKQLIVNPQITESSNGTPTEITAGEKNDHLMEMSGVNPVTPPHPPRPNQNNYTLALLFWWAFSSLVAFTIAGEKMPWLTFHIVLPMILLTGWGLGCVFERIDWKTFNKIQGILLAGSFILLGSSIFRMSIGIFEISHPSQGKDIHSLGNSASVVLTLILLVLSVTGIWLLSRQKEKYQIILLGVLVVFGFLTILTIRTSFRAAYTNFDDGTEFLVYAHGARGIKDIMDQASEISQNIDGGNNIVLAYDVSGPDTGVSWPFTWYLRNYPNIRPFDKPDRSLKDASIIIVDQKNFSNIEPIVSDEYYRFDYIRMVWPMQDYYNLTWDRIKNSILDPMLRAGIGQIWLDRDYSVYAAATGNQFLTLTKWEPSDKMRLYVRKDVAAQIWKYGIGSTSTLSEDPYKNGKISLAADLIIGELGPGDIQFNAPRGIATSTDGSIFIADSRNHRIQHLSKDGQFLKSWGSFSGGDPLSSAPIDKLNEPWGIAVSPDGNYVFVTDTWNHRVIKFTSDGIPIKTWGYANFGQNSDPYGLWGPRGIAIDSNNHVFVVDTGNKRIIVYDTDGNYLAQFGTAGMEPGQFDEPVGIAIDTNGDVYVVDTWNQRVQVFTHLEGSLDYYPLNQWDVYGWFGNSLDNKPFITVSPQGNVYVTDPEGSRVIEFSPLGNFVSTWGDQGSDNSSFGILSGVAINSDGQIWVCDNGNNRLLRFTLPNKSEIINP